MEPALAAASAAAAVGGGVLAGWVLCLLWRAAGDRRRAAELAHLRELVQAWAGRAQAAEEQVQLQRTRAAVEEAARREAELRAVVAEDEAEQLRRRLEEYERTPCIVCGVPPPLCPHGAEERDAWLGLRTESWERLNRYR